MSWGNEGLGDTPLNQIFGSAKRDLPVSYDFKAERINDAAVKVCDLKLNNIYAELLEKTKMSNHEVM